MRLEGKTGSDNLGMIPKKALEMTWSEHVCFLSESVIQDFRMRESQPDARFGGNG